jgi:cell division protein FtsW
MPLESLQRRRPDYLLLASTIALLVLGTLMIYSASYVVAHNEFNDDAYFLGRQLMWIGIGSAGMLLTASLDYRVWRKFSLAIMFGCISLLVLVLVPGIGASSYGAVRWLRLGPVQLQPSEIAKLAIVLYLADWLARRGLVVGQFFRGMLPYAIIVGVIAVLVAIQPDLGTTAIIVAVAACVFFVGGANLLHIVGLCIAGVGACGVVLAHLSSYQMDRVRAFLDPWSDVQGSGWHTVQGLIALGSGGPVGLGLGNGLHKAYWVPNAHTDAIFAIIGEELGFLGCAGVLILFGLLAWRGFLIAWTAPDAFGRLLATGITCMLSIQMLVNIAVVTNSLPYTGVTLPLVSFGGSSTVVSLIAIGLLLSMSREPAAAAAIDDYPHAPDRPAPPPPTPGPPSSRDPVPRTRVRLEAPRRHAPVKLGSRGVRRVL